MSDGSERVILARQKRKQDLVYIMGGKCTLCGYDKYIGALEFHHIDKTMKQYGLSSGNCHNWEDDIVEIKKCALVCSNCHKEIEAFNLEVANTFNEERYQELNEAKITQEITCQRCGKSITRGATYCADCWSFLNRRCIRPSREELKNLIRTKTFAEIGRLYSVVDNSIRKWCDSYNLPRTKRDISNITDDEWQEI